MAKIIILLLGLLLSPLANCGQTRTITDMNGKEITIPEHVTRIATNGAINQMVAMLGGIDKVVATGTSIQQNPLFARIYPQILKVPAVFSTIEQDPNMEALLNTHPQLMFGSNNRPPVRGVPVIGINLRSPEEIKQTIRLVGNVLGKEEEAKAEAFCQYYDNTIRSIRQRTERLTPSQRKKVFYAGSRGLATDGKESITTSWIETAGGINVAAEADIHGVGKDISMEQLVQWDPDIIIVASPTMLNTIASQQRWQHLRAVQKKQVYVNPKG